jgi:DNA methyltransferase 1-associated protein-1, putative (fragment)
MADVLDILEIGENQNSEENESEVKKLLKKKRINDESKGEDNLFAKKERVFKKPEGMSRELYALLSSDNNDGAPIIPSEFSTNSSLGGGYKQVKAKFGLKKAKPWRWMPFINSGRSDGFMLYHWRRVADEGKEYPFARFNKVKFLHS